jgi:hypothetical protein
MYEAMKPCDGEFNASLLQFCLPMLNVSMIHQINFKLAVKLHRFLRQHSMFYRFIASFIASLALTV